MAKVWGVRHGISCRLFGKRSDAHLRTWATRPMPVAPFNKSLEAEHSCTRIRSRSPPRCRFGIRTLRLPVGKRTLRIWQRFTEPSYARRSLFDLSRFMRAPKRGGMSPWAALPKDFMKLAKAAGLDGDQELEKSAGGTNRNAGAGPIGAPVLEDLQQPLQADCRAQCRLRDRALAAHAAGTAQLRRKQARPLV